MTFHHDASVRHGMGFSPSSASSVSNGGVGSRPQADATTPPVASASPSRLRDQPTSREARTVPTHDLGLFRGAMLEVAKLDAKLAVARLALEGIARTSQEFPAATAQRAIDRIEAM